MSEDQIVEIIYKVMKLVMDIERYQNRNPTTFNKRKLKTLRSNLTRTRKKLIGISLAEINAHKESALKRLVQEDPQRYQLRDGFSFSK